MSSTIRERAWRIEGRVQGVGFRWWTVRTGARLGASGRVWNTADGAVELHVRAGEAALAELSDRLRVGPTMARVERVIDLEPEGPWPEAGIQVVRS